MVHGGAGWHFGATLDNLRMMEVGAMRNVNFSSQFEYSYQVKLIILFNIM
jgi:hypothetical protein